MRWLGGGAIGSSRALVTCPPTPITHGRTVRRRSAGADAEDLIPEIWSIRPHPKQEDADGDDDRREHAGDRSVAGHIESASRENRQDEGAARSECKPH